MALRACRPAWGRVVLNHSTHAPGLIRFLERLASEHADAISAIVPARLATARGHAAQLQLRVTVPTPGGHKLIARAGTTVQECFVVTTLGAAALQAVIDAQAAAGAKRPSGYRRPLAPD